MGGNAGNAGLKKVLKKPSKYFPQGLFWEAMWAMQDLEKVLNSPSKYYPQGLLWEAMRAMQDLEKVLE